ncbi:MAG: hypothetical protein ACE5GC_05980 [Acidimicrobiia bacterium]
MRVVYVCTGNICRSPMAEAIARDVLPPSGVTFASGGIATAEGRAMTPEAVAALSQIGVDGTGHVSQGVAGAFAPGADIIYAMETVHVRWLVRRYPEYATRIALLDPDGLPIIDPYGSTVQEYAATRDHIARAIAHRKQDWV